ncbi:DUF3168 domain-containing protein [Massilia sp. YIM B02769]|uniref:DUF3168 domain-containing protein n=1 Tax=Massilia sp. YIM B02769 TaxID=3050129 RepID=UPI0025B72FF3|nr:DUF3168 domain-containing protein [Massilia sp. YIM B02769]MDN4061308.1 DUF3168 domain-containing protein [Massilia sp. YIM B02769]
MTPHEQIRLVLGELAGGRVFPGIADADTLTPYITFQVIGGPPINFVTGEAPAKRFVRVQINVWSSTSIEAFEVAAQVESALRAETALQVEALTGAGDTYDEVTEYRGAMQEFQLFV